MLERKGNYEIINLPGSNRNILVLYKSTETEDPFVVVAGYFLKQTGDFQETVLAEIETVPVTDYEKLKNDIRDKIRIKQNKRVPITFW
jgi:hypothetical protein